MRSHQDLFDPHTIHIHHLKRPTAPGACQLDEATWTAAWAEGQAMPLEQAVAYALEELPAA